LGAGNQFALSNPGVDTDPTEAGKATLLPPVSPSKRVLHTQQLDEAAGADAENDTHSLPENVRTVPGADAFLYVLSLGCSIMHTPLIFLSCTVLYNYLLTVMTHLCRNPYDNRIVPTHARRYTSFNEFKTDSIKHKRSPVDPEFKTRRPLTTSQEYGWRNGIILEAQNNRSSALYSGVRYGKKSSAETQYAESLVRANAY
jgi:hypothetical protein